MKEERRLTEWLADYRDSLDSMETPARVEARLRLEVRRRRRVSVAPWLLATGAAAVLVVGIWIGRSPTNLPLLPALAQAPRVMAAEVAEPAEPAELAAPEAPEAPLREVPRPVRRPLPPALESRSVAVFVMMPGSELLPPTQDLQVLRVRIPRTRIQALGWPVNVDRLEEGVLADVIVGDDGLARAVRLVRTVQ